MNTPEKYAKYVSCMYKTKKGTRKNNIHILDYFVSILVLNY